MSDGAANGRISVSEDKLRAMLAEFKLELFGELRKYATTDAIEALAKSDTALSVRVGALELAHARDEGGDESQRRMTVRQLAWASLFAGVFGTAVGGLAALATLVWLHHG